MYRPRPGRARHDGPRARADRSGRRAGPVLPFRHLAPAEGGRATGWAAPRDATPVSDGLISLMMPFIIDPTGGRLGFALRSLPFPLPFTCGLLVIAFHTLVARLGARHTLSHLWCHTKPLVVRRPARLAARRARGLPRITMPRRPPFVQCRALLLCAPQHDSATPSAPDGASPDNSS